ncbi:MAG: hypothetical protein IIZ53_04870 [Ruminococcus sp.]|nr:hypothetical protein [Ruminococcus sp.]
MRYECDEDFAELWKKFKPICPCPDTWTENVLVTYIKNNDPDNCEVIMQDKGCVNAEDMADVKEFRNHIISMAD